MSIFCYVHRRAGGVPHFEVLADVSKEDAIARATALLVDRPDSERAEVWDDEDLIATIWQSSGRRVGEDCAGAAT